MGHAFITTNPMLPKDYFAPKGVDGFVLRLNEGLEFSLLNCPGKYGHPGTAFQRRGGDQAGQGLGYRGRPGPTEKPLGRGGRDADRLAAGCGTRLRGLRVSRSHLQHRDRGAFRFVGHAAGRRRYRLGPQGRPRSVELFSAAAVPDRPGAVKPSVSTASTAFPSISSPPRSKSPARSIAADYRHDVSVRQAMFQGRE